MAATPVDPMSGTYAYVQVAADIERRIRTGEISVKLPSERSLAEEYGTAYATVRHAMDVLRQKNVIVTIHGRGTFVRPEEAS